MHCYLQILGQVGMLHRQHHRLGLLSGGEQRRVTIAEQLVLRKPILIMDEATSGLDAMQALHLVTFLKKITDSLNLSIVITI